MANSTIRSWRSTCEKASSNCFPRIGGEKQTDKCSWDMPKSLSNSVLETCRPTAVVYSVVSGRSFKLSSMRIPGLLREHITRLAYIYSTLDTSCIHSQLHDVFRLSYLHRNESHDLLVDGSRFGIVLESHNQCARQFLAFGDQ